MWRLIMFLVLLVASVWLGIQIMQHPGYLLIVYQPWMVQMPLWFALLSTIIIFVFFYLLIDSVDRLQFLWFRLKNWLRFRRTRKAYSKTQHGLALLIEGRFNKAERLLLAGVDQSIEPLMNYLGAAKAAHEQAAFDRRDNYIEKAYQAAPEAGLAIGLTQAELQLSHDQLEQAAATLHHLKQSAPRHPRVLKMLEKVYVRLADWKNLHALLPELRKAKAITAEQEEQFSKNIYCEIFQTAHYQSLNELHQMWEQAPRNMKKNPDVVYAYVKQLQRFEANVEIEELIRKTIKKDWHPGLVSIYSTLPFTNLNRQLVIAGAWLKIHGQKQELLMLLGRLCVRIQLWGKAKDYFERCLAEGPYPQAYLEQGKLFESLDQPEQALLQYRAALEAYVHSLERPPFESGLSLP